MNLKNNILKEDAPVGGGFPGGIGTGLTLPGGYINGAPTGSVDETNNTKPSSEMRPEPHPTRHETEHPTDEPDWHKKDKPYKSVSEILTKEEENKIFEEFLDNYFNSIMEGTHSDNHDADGINKDHNDDWEDYDNPDKGYTDMLPGWEVYGHLSDTLPKSITDKELPLNNHFEENGPGKRWIHPIKGDEYDNEKTHKWEMNPMATMDKAYKPEDEYKPVHINEDINEDPNAALDRDITYSNTKGEKKKITARNALRLPKDHPAHIQAAKIVGPDDAPVNEPKKNIEPGKASTQAAKPPQPGQPVKQGQTAQGKIDKPTSTTTSAENPEQQGPPPEQKLSGVELHSDAEKRAEKEKNGESEKGFTERIGEKIKNWSKEEKQFFTQKVHKGGSPERKDWGHRLMDKAKGAGASIMNGLQHEAHLFKTAGFAVGKLMSGKDLDENDKKAMKGVGIKIATTALFGGVTGGLAHGIGGFAAHVLKELIPHAVGEVVLTGVGKAAIFAEGNDEATNLNIFAAAIAERLENMDISPKVMEKIIDDWNNEKLKQKFSLNENLSESKENSINHFIEYATKKLNLKEIPKVTLLTGKEYSEAKTSLGGYNPMSKEIFVVVDGRLTADILRTLAHEMVHRKQDELGLVKDEIKDGATGSPIENQAHAVAGILMRNYGKINKQIYNEGVIPGGKSEGKTLQDFLKKYNTSIETIKNKIKKGAKVEMEHTSDIRYATEIAKDHIWEDLNYYEKLKDIEEDINIDVDKGDTVLMGKFKNKKVVVKDFGKDDHGMPTINGKVATTFRIDDRGQNVFKKDESINENLLLEGGAAGHLAHPFEDEDLTFDDMKEMINRGLIGGLDKEAPVSEKLDGQNIAFSVRDGKVVFGRNKGHVRDRGANALDVKGIYNQFKGRGGIEKAFVGAAEDLQAAVKKLSPQQIKKMFSNGSKFMSLEIILPETQNVIPYGKTVLVMHGTITYDKNGEQIERSTEDGKEFAEAVQKVGADRQKTFGIEGPKTIAFSDAESKEYTQKAKEFNSTLTATANKFGLSNKAKLGDYRKAWWMSEINNQEKKLGIKFSPTQKKGLVNRFADGDKSFGIKNFDEDAQRNWFKNFETNELQKAQKQMIKPIENVFLNAGAQSLKRVTNFLSSNNPKAANALKKETLQSIKGIRDSKDPDKLAKLQMELERLENIGMDKIVPSEGVVFQYNGKPYKFTGAFAPINQINGTFKFDKPSNKPKNEIAIFSGRFQPFHAGHYSIYKSLVDKFGKDNVYIASSDIKDNVKSPFGFNDKKNIIHTMFDIPTNKIVKVKNTYAPTEILDKLPKDTKYVTAVSQKDAERLQKGNKNYFKNYNVVPDNKKKPYDKEGYFIVAPEMQLKVNGKNISGTQLRATFGSTKIGIPEKKKIFKQIYPKFDKNVFAKIVVTTKKSEVAKKDSEIKSKEKEAKKQLSPSVLKNNPKLKKLLNTTIKNPETGRMIQVKTALGYDKTSKVKQNVDRMIKQQLKK
jgi:hypothetical protein